ncbi:long-chain-fatty-acid--CoA ligase [Hyphomonas sp.]|uniref:long-chain-fatty-acid--CoA ligase n=1 Tax=Hyphomonas sp. TaxID=87 RepID=UPI003F71CA27
MWVYPEIRTLGDYPAYWSKHDPDRPMLRNASRTITFAEMDVLANQSAHWLLEQGAAEEKLIGYFGKNSFDFYIALFGCTRTRAGLVAFNWRLAPVELAVQIADSNTHLIIAERELEPLLSQAVSELNNRPAIVWIDESDTFEARIASEARSFPPVFVQESDTAFQLYTSGTTGRPKGVMLAHHATNMMRLCEHYEPAYKWDKDDSFINALPNFHLLHLGIALQCLYNGVSITVERQFDPAAVLHAISTLKPTLLTLTPTMLQMLLDHPDAAKSDFSSLRLTLYAGSPISLGLIKRAIAAMPGQFMQFYGSTESGGAASILRPNEHNLEDEAKLQSCGRPLPLIEFRIVDQDGAEVPVGEPGELMIRTPSITKGYWRQPEVTASIMENGWYRSGDIARRDEEGLYYIVDRAKDMIVSGGENIYSAEVESALSTHPDVSAVAVIGVPDDKWGEAVKACVILHKDACPSEADLIAYARTRLAGYKVPKSITFMDSFPLVPSGKVSKKDLRSAWWGEKTRGVA